MNTTPDLYTLEADGVSAIIDLATGTPVVLHWGATLGKLNPVDLRRALQEGIPHADLDIYQNPGVWREGARGYLGRPAVLGHRNGVDWSQQFDIVDVKSSGNTLSVKSSDVRAALEVTVNFELSAPGILRISQTITNLGQNLSRSAN